MVRSTHGAGTLGNYKAPKHTTSTVRGSFMRTESAGVGSGLSARMGIDEGNIGIDYSRNPMNGNASERISENPRETRASEKGHKFTIC